MAVSYFAYGYRRNFPDVYINRFFHRIIPVAAIHRFKSVGLLIDAVSYERRIRIFPAPAAFPILRELYVAKLFTYICQRIHAKVIRSRGQLPNIQFYFHFFLYVRFVGKKRFRRYRYGYRACL